MKTKRIVCFQNRLFDDIVIQAKEEGAAVELPSDEIGY
jgi:segregation and condensation protein A